MKEKITFNRTVFDKNKFNETVDTEFSQLVTKPQQVFFDTSLATVDNFFTLYEDLFYEIPQEGENNSHQYLIKQSTEYVGFTTENENIQALLDEIASLREELLIANQNIAGVETEVNEQI